MVDWLPYLILEASFMTSKALQHCQNDFSVCVEVNLKNRFYLSNVYVKLDFHSVLFIARSTFCDSFLLNCEPSTGTDPVEGSQFKRKRSQKVDSATKSTEWKSAFRAIIWGKISRGLNKSRTNRLYDCIFIRILYVYTNKPRLVLA